jgi:hypothetical protein
VITHVLGVPTKREKRMVEQLRPVDPHYEAAMRELDQTGIALDVSREEFYLRAGVRP